MKNGRHISEYYGVGVLLAIVGGFLDSYTYICRGGVFANAQTGNIVLLGIHISEGKIISGLYYLIPILAFVLGVFVVEMIKSKFNDHPNIHWHRIVIVCEIVILAIVGFLPEGDLNTLANVLVSFICAMQVEAFRRMNGNPFATTMCTGNLRSATENLFRYVKFKDKANLKNAVQYYGIILIFIVGAAVGAIMTKLFDVRAIFFALIGLAAALIILRTDDDKNKA